MLYAVLCYNDEKAVSAWTPEEDAACMARLGKVQEPLRARGTLGPVVRLQNTSEAKTLRKSNGQPMVFDGPFAETKEQFLGFYVTDCETIDRPSISPSNWPSQTQGQARMRSVPCASTCPAPSPKKCRLPRSGEGPIGTILAKKASLTTCGATCFHR